MKPHNCTIDFVTEIHAYENTHGKGVICNNHKMRTYTNSAAQPPIFDHIHVCSPIQNHFKIATSSNT